MHKHIGPLALATLTGVGLGFALPHIYGAGVDLPSHKTVAATVTPSNHQTISDDDPGWNCLTMGNHKCGPAYKPMTSAQQDALAEGEDGDRDWSVCLIDVADTTIVVCPDGAVYTS